MEEDDDQHIGIWIGWEGSSFIFHSLDLKNRLQKESQLNYHGITTYLWLYFKKSNQNLVEENALKAWESTILRQQTPYRQQSK